MGEHPARHPMARAGVADALAEFAKIRIDRAGGIEVRRLGGCRRRERGF
jgi:hypothetical protein